jgi:CheY-like chemotaxis protein
LLNRAPILIVEDEPLIALVLQALVEDAEGEVVGPVGSASAALALLQTWVVAAAILDVHLQDRDVTPVAEVLGARNVPMVFHSAESLPPHLRLRHPKASFYQKPVEPTLLVRRLAEIVRG